jgi:hypothetical protein
VCCTAMRNSPNQTAEMFAYRCFYVMCGESCSCLQLQPELDVCCCMVPDCCQLLYLGQYSLQLLLDSATLRCQATLLEQASQWLIKVRSEVH